MIEEHTRFMLKRGMMKIYHLLLFYVITGLAYLGYQDLWIVANEHFCGVFSKKFDTFNRIPTT
jgi:hypothetical protein